jgi:hypothetical protein
VQPGSQPSQPVSHVQGGLKGSSDGAAVGVAGWLQAAAGCGKPQLWRAEGCCAPSATNLDTHLVCGVKACWPAAHNAKLQAAARRRRRRQRAHQLAATGPEQGPKRSPRPVRQHGCQVKGRGSSPGVGKGRVLRFPRRDTGLRLAKCGSVVRRLKKGSTGSCFSSPMLDRKCCVA